MYSDPINTFLSLQNHSGDEVVYNSDTTFVTNAPWSGFGKLGKFGKRAIATAMLPIALGMGSQALAGGLPTSGNPLTNTAIEHRIKANKELIAKSYETIGDLRSKVMGLGGTPDLPSLTASEETQTANRTGHPVLDQQNDLIKWQGECIDALQEQIKAAKGKGATGGASQPNNTAQSVPFGSKNRFTSAVSEWNNTDSPQENLTTGNDVLEQADLQKAVDFAERHADDMHKLLPQRFREYKDWVWAVAKHKYQQSNPEVDDYTLNYGIDEKDPIFDQIEKIANDVHAQYGGLLTKQFNAGNLVSSAQMVFALSEQTASMEKANKELINSVPGIQRGIADARREAEWAAKVAQSAAYQEKMGRRVNPNGALGNVIAAAKASNQIIKGQTGSGMGTDDPESSNIGYPYGNGYRDKRYISQH